MAGSYSYLSCAGSFMDTTCALYPNVVAFCFGVYSFLCANCGGVQELVSVLVLSFGSTMHPRPNSGWFDIPHMYLSSILVVTHGSSKVSKWVTVKEEGGLSPPRRRRHDSPDASPPRRRRHDSPDMSPPRRRQRHDSSPDASPPRRRRHDSLDVSPPRRHQRHDSSPDASPPRRRRHDILDVSPPRRRQRHDSSPDASPPRRRRHDSLDVSPPRCHQRHDSSPDASPPRRQKHDNYDTSPPRHHRHEDPDRKPSKYDDEVYRRAAEERTASGYKAGLQSSGDFKQVGNNNHELLILLQSPHHCLVLLLNFSLSTPQFPLLL